jgi:hypothetical protein
MLSPFTTAQALGEVNLVPLGAFASSQAGMAIWSHARFQGNDTA